MNFNDFLTVVSSAGIIIETERTHIKGKIANLYHLSCKNKHGQKIITIEDPNIQLSNEMENELYSFLLKMQE